MYRTLTFIPAALLLSCSMAMKATIFNYAEKVVTVCGGGVASNYKCTKVEPGSSVVVTWAHGNFEVIDAGQTLSYTVSMPKDLKRYVDRKEGAVSLVLYKDMALYIMPASEIPLPRKLQTKPSGVQVVPMPNKRLQIDVPKPRD